MSKRLTTIPFFLLFTSAAALITTALVWAYPPLPTAPIPADVGIPLAWTPFAIFALVGGVQALRWRLRAPDFVITVTQRPTPLEAKFLEQDRRLERRERLKGEVFKNECEIEAFAANLTPDERKAWFNRPGPYGK